MNCLVIGAGGAIGSISRYLVGHLPIRMSSGFPLATLGINVCGAFCIGLIVALAGRSADFSPRLLLFLQVGFCGGFTTFSAFSLETVRLLQNGKYISAAAYVVLSVILCVAAVAGAQMLVKNPGI